MTAVCVTFLCFSPIMGLSLSYSVSCGVGVVTAVAALVAFWLRMGAVPSASPSVTDNGSQVK